MSNVQLSYKHGSGSNVNVRAPSGRIILNGEIEVEENTGQVLICTDHDVVATSDEWAGAYPDGGSVWEAENPNYVADSAVVVARRGAAVYATRTTPGSAYDATTNPYSVIGFASGASSVFLGTVDGKDVLEGDPTFNIRFTDKLPTAIAAAAV